jgi:hypothetical protein
MASTITSPLADDLAKIPGVSQGFAPVSVNNGRYVFTGRPGSGKSTFLHSNPRAFILDPEGGGATVDDPQAGVYVVPNSVAPGQQAKAYKDMATRIIDRKRRGKNDIQMLGIDTIDKMIDLFLRDFCLNKGIEDPLEYKDGNGNAYTIVRQDIFGMLDSAHRAGLGWALLAHVTPKTRKIGSEEKIVQSLSVSDSFSTAIKRECEHMLFLEFAVRSWTEPGETKVVAGKTITLPGEPRKENVRHLRTKPGGVWKGESTSDVKVRVPFPDKVIIPRVGGWGVLTKAYDEAVATLTGKNGETHE